MDTSTKNRYIMFHMREYDASNPKTSHVGLRLTPKERDILDRAAAEHGTTLGGISGVGCLGQGLMNLLDINQGRTD